MKVPKIPRRGQQYRLRCRIEKSMCNRYVETVGEKRRIQHKAKWGEASKLKKNEGCRTNHRVVPHKIAHREDT